MEALIYIPILLIAISPALYGVAQYNVLTALRARIRESWSEIDSALRRRYELIPRLLETARGFTANDEENLKEVAAIRERCVANRGPVSERDRDEAALVRSLRTLLAHVEASPAVKTGGHFPALRLELVDIEDRIQSARRIYNANVQDYRRKCASFPGSIIANLFSFGPMAFFNAESAIHETPHPA